MCLSLWLRLIKPLQTNLYPFRNALFPYVDCELFSACLTFQVHPLQHGYCHDTGSHRLQCTRCCGTLCYFTQRNGVGVLKNHPLQQSLVQLIYDKAYLFFNSDEKNEYRFHVETQDGFFPSEVSEVAKGHTVKDIKEYFHYYPWGQCPLSIKADLSRYYEDAGALASELLRWVEQYSPEEVAKGYSQPLSSMIEGSDKTLLRVLHYPPMTGTEEAGAIRAAAHEDINLLTILPAANEPGLQVKLKDGTWKDVPCDFGNLIINIGDMLQEASGGISLQPLTGW